MDAIGWSRCQHGEILGLFEDFDEDDNPAEQQLVAHAVGTLLLSHMTVEEAVFFPALTAAADLERAADEATELHHLTRQLISDLRVTDPVDRRFAARFRLLRRLFHQHITQEEESLLSPVARCLSRDALRAIGHGMEHLFERVRLPLVSFSAVAAMTH